MLYTFMREKVLCGRHWAWALLVLWLSCGTPSWAQVTDEAARLSELRRLRDELQLNNGLRNADVVVVLSERAVIEAARQLVGLEIALNNGGQLRLTSVASELQSGAAIVKLGVQAKSSITLNMELTGRVLSGELTGDVLRLPYRVTDVKLQNNLFSALLIKTLFGGWLTPQKWNDELPALELPLRVVDAMNLPANRFAVAGAVPMEIATPAYQAPLRLALASLLVLDKRAVLALRLEPGAGERSEVTVASKPSETDFDAGALSAEIERLSADLRGDSDVRVRLSRRVLSALLEQIAAQHAADLNIQLKQGRLRAEEVSTIVTVTNYTDVEGGAGQADISQLRVESIADGGLNVRVSGQGALDAQLRGREYGIPYRLSPRVNFAIKDQLIPLRFVNEGERALLRAAPGATLPIDMRFSLSIAGRALGIDRRVAVEADRWLNRLELPALLEQELSLPRKLQADKEGKLHVVDRKPLGYKLSQLSLGARKDALEITANVAITPR
jgi:hypothetical protein